MQNPSSTSGSVVTKLSVMMFLQFFLWGAWFVTLGQCLGVNNLTNFIGGAYGTAPIAAIFAPLFLGIVADRLFPSEKVMGILLLLGGVMMWFAAGAAADASVLGKAAFDAATAAGLTGEALSAKVAEATAAKGGLMHWLFLGHMLCYMPTLGLGNTIVFSNVHDSNLFPRIRVWGTIGWIVAGLLVGAMNWSSSINIFKLAAGSSLVLGLLCFALPNTPPPAKGKKLDIKALLMVDAFRLLGKPAFLVFIICSTLICIPLAYYYGLTSNYLGNAGFAAPASSMSIGQMSEIIFMLLIPFFLRRLGVKYMIAVGMLAWAVRYALFALGAPDHIFWMMFIGIALHGICYDFFFVTGFMYTDKTAPAEVRGQAQSMLVFFTQGIGMYFGYQVAFGKFGGTVTKYDQLTQTIKKAATGAEPTFWQSLGQMFSTSKPAVDPALLSDTMTQWKSLWFQPALMAAGILVLFFAAFWDKGDKTAP